MPLTSVADIESAEAVDELGISAFKLSSEDLINLPLLEHVAKKRKPLLLSTGMADEEEVDDALRILDRHGCRDVVFLHCVSVYPTPSDEANLLRMRALADKVCGAVGYSDHTLGITAAIAAVALGACVIEKHFTLDRGMPGPDHYLSSGPDEFAALVAAVRETEKMLGKKRLEPSATERRTRLQFRRSIVANRDLPKGHVLSGGDLALKRPGSGLRAREMGSIVGRRLARAVAKDQRITYKSLW
jgi:N-acetylneuraminate synthase/N,N'-diacetyllegionaminate synthase